MYRCECGWQGSELYFDPHGHGKCPLCGRRFVGCISQEAWDRLNQYLAELHQRQHAIPTQEEGAI
jgi:hypothetical protein